MATRKAQRQSSSEISAWPRLRPWSVCASLALHLLLVVALALSPAPRAPLPAQEDSVSVDMITPQQMEITTTPKPAPPVLQVQPINPDDRRGGPSQQPATALPPASSGMVRATQMLSARTLADPRSRNVRADLASMAGSERRLQICDVEAMDQIRQWRSAFTPDRVVPYATARERISGTQIQADGAAFRSKGIWYGLKFRCELAADGETVTGFAFLVGDPVPRARWDELGLASVH